MGVVTIASESGSGMCYANKNVVKLDIHVVSQKKNQQQITMADDCKVIISNRMFLPAACIQSLSQIDELN